MTGRPSESRALSFFGGAARATAKTLVWLAVAAPPLAIVVLIARFGVDVPYWEDWLVIPLLAEVEQGSVPFLRLLEPYAGHRPFFLYLGALAVASMSGFDLVLQMFLGLPLFLTALFLLWRTLRLSLSGTGLDPLEAPLVASFSAFVFTAAAAEIWTYGWNALGWGLSSLCVAALVWAFTRWPGRWPGTVIALCCAAVSSLTLGQGLALWILGALALAAALALQPSERSAVTRQGLVWCLTAVAFLFAYFRGNDGGGLDAGLATIAARPRSFVLLVLAYLGLPLSLGWSPAVSAVVALAGSSGIVAALAWTVVAGRRLVRCFLPWTLLMLYAVIAAFMTIAGRASAWQLRGEILMGSPRYVGVASLFWIGGSVLVGGALFDSLRDRDERPAFASLWVASLAVVGVAGAYALSYAAGVERIAATSRSLSTVCRYLPEYGSMPAEILGWAFPPQPEWARGQVGVMDRLGLDLCAERQGDSPPKTLRAGPSLGPVHRPGPGTLLLDVSNDWPATVRREELSIGGESRRVIFAHPPAEIVWPIRLPREESILLETHLAMSPEMWRATVPSDGVTFEVAVGLPSGVERVLARRHVDAFHREEDRRWIQLRADLGRFAGKAATLRLRTSAGPAGDTANDWAAWGDPVLSIGAVP